ncbi:leucine zipper protein 1 [Tachysurus vachellii]|uniref:leucine zipper protein 1 n=1 Tax=Tachysurus vachellii TaxID=175792 RepID=UPI00296B2A9F|nr:leucine zipper protein 1 [Tachysurus vachellii]XP_060736387.1 leucine zipper protein 1 [Tachysurus vachellii]XP_060736388.1 leucine zipper protein 1 [Tachysurus vachellii]XP_060736389.1 leucine zipper protein 1 [Tachysurus vachellii]XP_060736390.1 leucine zipper protein 1 [Tachysurus vachellii]XP_060736392.1 leucine zipper protein 1 [Tachysurus vachellii]
MTEFKDTTNRHLRHKLQSLGRRLDELEEATSKLQKAEDELLDLQDKIIQAEGSNSSLLGDVEALRKRVLKIEGKDEEVRKAEDLCRLIKEKLEEEENLTKELKAEIERLQLKMTDLEKLEEAFGKSKSDCTQLCLSLNEEKNLTKKLSAELEALKARVKEVDASEVSLTRAEQALTTELEKLKSLTQTFVVERKKLLEKQREDEKIILKLTEKLEQQKSKVGSLDHSLNESHELIIEDDLSAGLGTKLARKKKLSQDVGLRNKSENEKNCLEGPEDNKIKDLTQEVENLKSRLKQLEMVEEDLKNTESKNTELEVKFQQERSRNQVLNDQLEQLKIQFFSSNGSLSFVSSTPNVLENGKAETEEINVRGGSRQEKKCKVLAATEAVNPKYKKRDNSPQQLKFKSKDLSQAAEKSPTRRALSPAHRPKKTGLKTGSSNTADSGLKYENTVEDKLGSALQATSENKVSVLSRYPPAARDQKTGKVSVKPGNTDSKKASRVVSLPEKDKLTETESTGPPQEVTTVVSLSHANGSYAAYRSHVTSSGAIDHGSEGHSSASETESVGSKRSVGEQDTTPVISIIGGRTTESKYSRYARLQDTHSAGSSTRSSYDEEQHRALMLEGGSQEPFQTSTGIEIQRVCSPREALCSKVLIKPAIIEYDRKEIMSGGSMDPTHTNEKPKIASKPNKMTSSITFYPNDPSASRSSSRSSSVSSEPLPRNRHTSTSNIVIGPNPELRGSITIPYEISIPKSEITLRSADSDIDNSELPNVLETARIETTILSRSSLNFQSPEMGSELNNSESGFESNESIITTATVMSQRSHNNDHCSSQEDNVPEMRNVTVRSAWRNRGSVSADQVGQGPRHDGLEDETEPTTTWRAYRATTVLDTEENLTSPNVTARVGKPSPAERYMRRISSGNTARDSLESSRRNKSVSPIDSSLQKIIPHEPVCAQQLQPRMRKEHLAVDESEPAVTTWRRRSVDDLNPSERRRGRGSWTGKASVGDGSRPWNSRQLDN